MLNYILIAQAQDNPEGGGLPMTILMFGAIFLIMYFFMIRPQQKKAKDQKKFISELKKGEQIVTIGGIHGVISRVEDNQLVIETEGHNKLRIDKTAISLEGSKSSYGSEKVPAKSK